MSAGLLQLRILRLLRIASKGTIDSALRYTKRKQSSAVRFQYSPTGRKSHDQNRRIAFTASRITPRPDQRQVAAKQALNEKWQKPDVVCRDRMLSHVQILTTPSADVAGTTLLLHFDHKRYLIGSMGEGTQRGIVSAGHGLFKISDCFITGRSEWRNLGGLLGTFLTLADSVEKAKAAATLAAAEELRKREEQPELFKKPARKVDTPEDHTLTLFGPPNLNHLLATARRFVFRKGMPVHIHEIDSQDSKNNRNDDWTPFFSDECVKVWAMSISPAPVRSESNLPQPMSPRKRGHDEIDSIISDERQIATESLQPESQDKSAVQEVVNQMFSSDWHLDTLYETKLADVVLPATIFYRDTETKRLEKYEGPLPGQPEITADHLEKIVLVRKPWPAALVESLPKTQVAPESISYIIRTHRQRGKFDAKKAKELKVDKLQFKKITDGQSVINSEGTLILPEQIMEPDREGGGLAIVDLPDVSYVDNLISRREWREPLVMAGVEAIVWICGPGVSGDPRLTRFMEEFRQLRHVVSSPDVCTNALVFPRVATSNARLHEIDPKRFPDLVFEQPPIIKEPQAESRPAAADPGTSNTQEQYTVKTNGQHCGGTGGVTQNAQDSATKDAQVKPHQKKEAKAQKIAEAEDWCPGDIVVAQRGMKIQLVPGVKIIKSEIFPPVDFHDVVKSIPESVSKEAKQARSSSLEARESIANWAAALPPLAQNAELIALGTGSSMPSLYRNVSATLLRVPGWGNVLFDCGEGTLGQIQRIFPCDEARDIIRDLRILWISHMHADHHLGTVGVIKAWYETVHQGLPGPAKLQPDSFHKENTLAVISDAEMQKWLVEYAEVEDYGYSRLAPLAVTPAFPASGIASTLRWFDNKEAVDDQAQIGPALLNLGDFQAVPVSHCKGARAVSITFPDSFKMSYSGDCRPSTQFSEIGKDSTVCIHEATFDDELGGDALAKKHSTTSEALSIADAMNAKACLLTHFSQRYQKMPVIERALGPTAVPTLAYVENVSQHDNDADDDGVHMTNERSQHAIQEPDSNPTQSGDLTANYKLQSDMKVAVAFDYMRIKIGEFPEVGLYTKAISTLFHEEEQAALETTKANKKAYEDDKKKKREAKEAKAKGKGEQNGKSASNAARQEAASQNNNEKDSTSKSQRSTKLAGPSIVDNNRVEASREQPAKSMSSNNDVTMTDKV